MPTGPALLDLLPDLARALAGDGPALLPLSATDPRAGEIARALGAGEPLGPGEDDPAEPTALVVATSGSTGTPKGVLLSAGALAASAAATEARLGGPGNWLLALPANHIAGLQVLLRAAAAGAEAVVMDTAEPFTSARFAAAAVTVPGPRRYVSLVPTQLQRLLADPDAAAAAADLFDAVLVGGAAAPAALLESARQAGISVVTTYGMTETCGGCVYDGRPLDGVTASVSDAGALVLSGPLVARGYRNRPGDPAFATPGSFVTADTGAVSPTGTLTITGRLDDVIVTGGVKVAPAPVEAALLALPGIADALVVGTPDPQWGQAVTAIVVTAGSGVGGEIADGIGDTTAGRRDGALSAQTGGVPAAGGTREIMSGLSAIRAALAHLPAAHRPRRIVEVRAIPLLPSGKPDRAAARRIVSEPPHTLRP